MDGVTLTFGQKPFATKARRAPLRKPFNGSPTAWRDSAYHQQAEMPGSLILRLRNGTDYTAGRDSDDGG
jgi:hypothetical protein